MIEIERKLDISPIFDFSLVAPRERIIFFDIETTGLTAGKASIYLIGTVCFEDGGWKLRQFFAESMYDELSLLESFAALVNSKKKLGRVILVSYNGDGFDIPFIKKCMAQYSVPWDMNGILSIDLLKKIRPFKKLLGLEDCRLKTVERLCGICREDKYSGGELIYVYEEYQRLSRLESDGVSISGQEQLLKEALFKALILHNAEDIADMPLIMPLTAYQGLFDGDISIESSSVLKYTYDEGYAFGYQDAADIGVFLKNTGKDRGVDQGEGIDAGTIAVSVNEKEGFIWDIRARLGSPLPKGIYYEDEYFKLSIGEDEKDSLDLAVNLFSGELKYFFADYKNYYYLPAEDYAIHKSVGGYVDRKARRQAAARNCYQKKKGLFVPDIVVIFTAAFYKEYKKAPAYGDFGDCVTEDGSADKDLTKRYVMSVLNSLK